MVRGHSCSTGGVEYNSKGSMVRALEETCNAAVCFDQHPEETWVSLPGDMGTRVLSRRGRDETRLFNSQGRWCKDWLAVHVFGSIS